jgi:hypothetical protein
MVRPGLSLADVPVTITRITPQPAVALQLTRLRQTSQVAPTPPWSAVLLSRCLRAQAGDTRSRRDRNPQKLEDFATGKGDLSNEAKTALAGCFTVGRYLTPTAGC